MTRREGKKEKERQREGLVNGLLKSLDVKDESDK